MPFDNNCKIEATDNEGLAKNSAMVHRVSSASASRLFREITDSVVEYVKT